MEAFTRAERIGAGLLCSLLFGFGAIAAANGKFALAVLLLLVALFGLGGLLGKASAVGRPLLSLGLVALLYLGVTGSTFVYLGLAYGVLVAGSFGIGYLLPTRWTPAFAAIIPLAGVLIVTIAAIPALKEEGVVFLLILFAVINAVLWSALALACSYAGIVFRRRHDQSQNAPVSTATHAVRW